MQGFRSFFKRRFRVVGMQLVEVDVIRLQAAQRGVYCVEQMFARIALVPGIGACTAVGFGGEDELMAPALKPAADDFFRSACALLATAKWVDVSGVD